MENNTGGGDEEHNKTYHIEDSLFPHDKLNEHIPTTTTKPLVSVIMPAYNLSNIITASINAVENILKNSRYSYEIIIVDDGSPDDTYQQALKASKNPTVRVYRLPRNMGKGFALLYGFKKSWGDIVVFFDGDLDIDPRQIHLLVNTLRSKGMDIVITSKWHPQSRTIATPLRKSLSRAFYALARLFLGLKVSDTQTGAKAFRREVLEDIAECLTVKRYAFDVELLTAATARGYRIAEVPAPWRIKLTSRFRAREMIRMLIDLMAVAYRHRVKKQYTKRYRRRRKHLDSLGNVVVVLVNKAGHPIPFPGGIERYVFELSKALARIGLNVSLVSRFALREPIKLVKGLKLLNVSLPLWRVSNEGSLLWGIHYILGTLIYCFRAFITALKDRTRIVHVNDGLAALIMSILSRLSGKRFLVLATIHAPPPWVISYGMKPLLVKLGYISLYLPGIVLADGIISVNPYTCLALRTYQSQCVFIPNAVPENFCEVDEESIEEVLEKYGIGREYYLFVSRLVPEKGLDRLLKVLRYYHRLGGKAQLVIVGRGPLEHYIDKLKNINNKVIHLKYVPRNYLKALYRGALALIVTSYAEGMPTTVLEALACNTPVILFTEKEIVDTIRNTFKSEDAKDKVITVTNTLEMANVMKKLESNNVGRTAHCTTITWGDTAIRILSIYRDLLSSLSQQNTRTHRLHSTVERSLKLNPYNRITSLEAYSKNTQRGAAHAASRGNS